MEKLNFTIQKTFLNEDVIYRDGKNEYMEHLVEVTNEFLNEEDEEERDCLSGEIWDLLDSNQNPEYNQYTNYLVQNVAELLNF
jgi:hypothetical protein